MAAKPTTALCLAATSLALAYPGVNSRLAFAVALGVTVIASLDLLDLFGVDSGINRLNAMLIPRGAVRDPEIFFHALNGVPAAFLVLAGSLALSRFERYRFAATAAGGVAGVVALFALLNYMTGLRTLYGSVGLPTPLTSLGLLSTVVALILRIGTMPPLRKPRPLGHLLNVLGCAIIAPLLLFGVYMGLRITDAQFHNIRKDMMSTARTLSAEVDREVVGQLEILLALAASPALHRGDFGTFQRQAESSASLQNGSIALIDRDLRQIVNTLVPFGTTTQKTAVPDAVQRVFATGQPQITGLFMSPVSNRFTFGIVAPVQIGGENRYALVRSPSPHLLTHLVATTELPEGWHAVVSDSARHVVAWSSDQDAFVGAVLAPEQQHRDGPAGVSEFVNSAGVPVVEAYTRSALTGWQTAVWAPTDLLDAPVWAMWWTIGLTSILAFSLVAAFTLWLGRLIAQSVNHAARAAIALGRGGPLALAATPILEVNTLMAELQGAAARRDVAEHDLQASKDRLQLALDAARLGSFRYEPLRDALTGDSRVKELFDFDSAQDEAGIEELIARIHPDDRERFRAVRDAALNPADPKPYVNEYRIQRRDGTIRWVEALGRAYFEGDGPERRAVNFVGTVADVTERKEREEKEHLLMREINHRAKNMLSVVEAIVRQTAARNPEDFVERFSERVQALSASQDLLVRNEWKGVGIEELVRAQLALFADLVGSRITLRGPKLRLNAASAQAIGLALHELATNAGKYGALSTDAGRVNVSWGRDGDTLAMSWIERGGPPVSPPARRGFGTVVMEAMAARSVDGKVDLAYDPEGLSWRLTCPVASALERRW